LYSHVSEVYDKNKIDFHKYILMKLTEMTSISEIRNIDAPNATQRDEFVTLIVQQHEILESERAENVDLNKNLVLARKLIDKYEIDISLKKGFITLLRGTIALKDNELAKAQKDFAKDNEHLGMTESYRKNDVMITAQSNTIRLTYEELAQEKTENARLRGIVTVMTEGCRHRDMMITAHSNTIRRTNKALARSRRLRRSMAEFNPERMNFRI
jgi:hypothetical protein